MNARMYQTGDVLDYTNSGASVILGGTLVSVGGRAGVAINDIAVGAQGALQVKGVAAILKKDETIEAGLPIHWDADGDPKVGTAGAGAATGYPSAAMAAADILCGSSVYAAAAADKYVYVDLNEFNLAYPAFANRTHVKKTADYTILGTDNGKVIHVDGSAEVDDIIILTLTAIATLGDGFSCIIVNDAADGESQCQIELDAGDKFLNPTALDDGDQLHNTLATSKRGDFVAIRTTAAGVYVEEMRGTWADGGA